MQLSLSACQFSRRLPCQILIIFTSKKAECFLVVGSIIANRYFHLRNQYIRQGKKQLFLPLRPNMRPSNANEYWQGQLVPLCGKSQKCRHFVCQSSLSQSVHLCEKSFLVYVNVAHLIVVIDFQNKCLAIKIAPFHIIQLILIP